MSGNFIGLLGIVVILAIAYLLSGNRKAINLRIVGAAFALQAAIAAFVIYSGWGKTAIAKLKSGWPPSTAKPPNRNCVPALE